MSSGYLLDTNHLGHAVTSGSIVRTKLGELRARGTKIGTCVPVLCEIEAGVQQVKHPQAYRTNLDRLMQQVRIWPIDGQTARIYGSIYQDLKRRGRVLSQVDMMLASLAIQMDLTLVTTDQDFAALTNVSTENWLA